MNHQVATRQEAFQPRDSLPTRWSNDLKESENYYEKVSGGQIWVPDNNCLDSQ